MSLLPRRARRNRGVDVLDMHREPGPHVIAISDTDQDCPGVFEVRCSCYGIDPDTGLEHGFLSWAPFGEEMAVTMAEDHLARVGEKGARTFWLGETRQVHERRVKFDRGGKK